MDILLNSFVTKKYINEFNDNQLKELEKILNYEDEVIFELLQ